MKKKEKSVTSVVTNFFDGRGEETRTPDTLVPIEKFMYKYGNGNYLYPNDTRAKIIAMNRIGHENLRKVEPTK